MFALNPDSAALNKNLKYSKRVQLYSELALAVVKVKNAFYLMFWYINTDEHYCIHILKVVHHRKLNTTPFRFWYKSVAFIYASSRRPVNRKNRLNKNILVFYNLFYSRTPQKGSDFFYQSIDRTRRTGRQIDKKTDNWLFILFMILR